MTPPPGPQDDPPPGPQDGRRNGLPRQLAGFAVAGGIAFVVDAGVLTLGTAILGLMPEIARIPSFLCAVLTTWMLNRTLTFRTTRPPRIAEFLSYLSAMALGLAINYAVFVAVIRASDLATAWPVLALVPATLAGMVVNFLTSRRILDR